MILDPKIRKRHQYLVRVYGITLDQYNELLERQGGGCAICGKTPEEEGKNLAVDHCHTSGEVRGICCSNCNHRIIGRYKSKDSEKLRKVAHYLEQGTGWFVPKKTPKKRKKKK